MSREQRNRIVYGIGVPLGALALIALILFALSRILLAVPDSVAPVVALLFAANVLVAGAVTAAAPGTRRLVAFLLVVTIPVLAAGGVGLALGEEPVERLVKEEAGPATPVPGPSPSGPAGKPTTKAEITAPSGAAGSGFDVKELSLKADAKVTVTFTNDDSGVPHDWAVYDKPGGKELFRGEIITGPDEIEYAFTTPEAGTYHFQCDVHPSTMTGTLTVA